MSESPMTSSEPGTAAGAQAFPTLSPQLMLVLGALALTALLYWQTSIEIVDFWQDTARRRYTHGWAVLAVTVWLIWRDRRALQAIPLQAPLGGWVVVGLGSLAWLVGFNAGLLVPTMLVLPMLVLAAVWAVGGLRLALRVAFPVLYLYFALPIWDAIDLPLQWLTTVVSLWAVGLVGVPATTDGYVIHIPEGWFEIASSCNGLHFFIVALAIGAVHGHVDRASWPTRVLLLAIAGGLALFTNWLRVFIVIVAGHLTDMQHFLVKVDHYYFGWVLFAVALVVYVFVAPHPRKGAPREDQVSSTSAATGVVPRLVATVLSVAALAAGPAWSQVNRGTSAAPVPLPVVADWQGPTEATSDWRPIFANADQEWRVEYRAASSTTAELYLAVYARQRQGKELRGYGNSATGTDFLLRSSDKEIRLDGITFAVSEREAVSDGGTRRLVWSFFAIGGQPKRMGMMDQLDYGLRALGDAPSAAVVALATECRADCDEASEALDALSSSTLPALLAALGPLRHQ